MTETRLHSPADRPERHGFSRSGQRFLADAGAILAASLDHDETLASIAHVIVPELADWCAVAIIADKASERRCVVAHVDGTIEAGLREIDWPAEWFPQPDVLRYCTREETQPVLLRDATAIDQSTLTTELIAVCRQVGTSSMIAAPMEIRGRKLGVILLGASGGERVFGEADLPIVADLARRAAVALDNARLYQEARMAEERVRKQAERIKALEEASNAFAMARLDLDNVLVTIAQQVGDMLGDVCSIRLISDDGQLAIPVAFHHTNPEAFELFKTLRSFGPRRVDEGTVGHVLKTGEPLLISGRTLEDWRGNVLPDWIPYIERYGMHSLLIVPMRAGGTTIGTLGLWRESTLDPFTIDDQRFLQELADRAGLAVDNARLYSDAQAAIKARDEFLSVAAHELKTPVTSLRGYAQLLLRQSKRGDEIPPERLRAALASIDRQTFRLSSLISQLLDTSRIHSGELRVQTSSTDIAELIAELVEHARTLSDVHDIRIDVAKELVADIDSVRVEQVLTNLIENAIKYSPRGGVISIEAGRAGDEWMRIAVEDTGPGIPIAEQDRIFERFYQLDNRGTATGMGLGLYISRQIINLHGGSIVVESPESGGARFVVLLPLRHDSHRA
jgi:signal transduction histidine kinase